MDTIDKLEHIYCTGCMACANSCPKKCIEIYSNEEGFIYPKIKKDNCVKCGICYKVCPLLNDIVEKNEQIEIYAAQRKDNEIIKSASGGIASLIAEDIIKKKGVVYGVVYDEELYAKHIKIDKYEELWRLRGSKYVQSDCSEIYLSIKKECESGKIVGVFGTPCQIAGIKSFLNRTYDNLLLIDIICHGVPSNKLFHNYLDWKSEKLGYKVEEFNFRDKSRWGWGPYYSIKTIKGKKISNGFLDPYYSAFEYSEISRESCYRCHYSSLKRVSDITLGDFWGVRKYYNNSNFYINRGVSAVLINSSKGRNLMNSLKKEMILLDIRKQEVSDGNSCLLRAPKRPVIRNDFYHNVDLYGFEWANRIMKKRKRYYLNLVKCMIPSSLKNAIKQIMKRA